MVYWLADIAGFSPVVQQIACAVVVIGLRMLAVHYNWSLPILKVDNDDEFRE